ncbi:MAG: CpXC domain-containing protein [Deltaproteobacteria bacterium]|nr:CpXC domain-containing protein [Deltaproteobacteria bacterium]
MPASIVGTTSVTCPACGQSRDNQIVQSINTATNPAAKQRLLDGELNVLVCDCGRRTQLAANVLFHDPDADYFCQVCPGGEAAMDQAAQAFRGSGAEGTQRIVPSLNALVEKVKLLDAGLEDWAIEMAKVLLLASTPEQDLDRVLLFDDVDHEAGVLHWMLFDPSGSSARSVASPLAAYGKLASRTHGRPGIHELRIDRAWGLEAVRRMITGAN